MLVDSCYVLLGMAVTKVSFSKIDLRGHSRSLTLVPLDRPHTANKVEYNIYDFLLVYHRNCVSVLHCQRYIITHFLKFKEVTWL